MVPPPGEWWVDGHYGQAGGTAFPIPPSVGMGDVCGGGTLRFFPQGLRPPVSGGGAEDTPPKAGFSSILGAQRQKFFGRQN